MAVAITAYYADSDQGSGRPIYETRLGADCANLSRAWIDFAREFDSGWEHTAGPGPEFPELGDDVIDRLKHALVEYKVSRQEHRKYLDPPKPR